MEKNAKPSIGVLIALKAKEKKGKGKSEKDYDKMYTEMAEELLDAAKAGDTKSFGKHLKDFVKTCAHNPCGMEK